MTKYKYYVVTVRDGAKEKYKVQRKNSYFFGLITVTKWAMYWQSIDTLYWCSYKDLSHEYDTEKEAEAIIAIAMKVDNQGVTIEREVPPFLYHKE